jgi:hypothetical protein
MSLKDIFGYPFKDWIRPIIIMWIGFPIFLLSSLADIGLLMVIGGGLFFLGSFLSIISIFYLLYKREGWKAFYTFVFILLTIMIFGLAAN